MDTTTSYAELANFPEWPKMLINSNDSHEITVTIVLSASRSIRLS